MIAYLASALAEMPLADRLFWLCLAGMAAIGVYAFVQFLIALMRL